MPAGTLVFPAQARPLGRLFFLELRMVRSVWRRVMERFSPAAKFPRRHPVRTRLGMECLEAREVPATFVSGTTLTYQDVDGDDVTVRFSKSILTAGNVN